MDGERVLECEPETEPDGMNVVVEVVECIGQNSVLEAGCRGDVVVDAPMPKNAWSKA